VSDGTIPYKTSQGQAEWSTRERRVSQRHRTVLFLVDGKRSLTDVRTMAASAGVPDTCFDELVDMGLIMVADPTMPMPLDLPLTMPSPLTVNTSLDLLLDIPASQKTQPAPLSLQTASAAIPPAVQPSTRPPAVPPVARQQPAPPPALPPVVVKDFKDIEEPALPASLTMYPEESIATDSMLDNAPAPDSWLPLDADEPHVLGAAIDEARLIMERAVRLEAPIAGSLTVMRLRRATTHSELMALLGEVETRITKPHRLLAASQTMKRVRDLLEGRVNPLQISD
jgi:hypothetical protein